MAKREFRRGKDLIQKAAEKKSKRKFTPSIFWRPGDVSIIAFVTAADEIPKVRVHQMVNFPDDSRPTGIRYETFICKKDPSMLEESGGECELCDRVGAEAAERFISLAIELEAEREDKRVKGLNVKYVTGKRKKDDGSEEEVEFPRWGLIIQAAGNFYNYFAAYDESQGDIRDVAWEIQREGGGGDTKYHRFLVMNGTKVVDLPDLSKIVEEIPTLDDLLEEMASEEHYAQVAELAPGSQPVFGSSTPKRAKSDDGAAALSGDRAEDFEKIRVEMATY